MSTRALIFCAGLGTRLGKLTKDTPKVMLDINGKPCLEHIVDHLNEHGIKDIIVNLHHHPTKIIRHFGSRLLYYYEPELLGEEETEKRLRPWLGDRYVLMNGDTLTDIDITVMKDMSDGEKMGKVEFWDFDKKVYAGTKYVNLNYKEPKSAKAYFGYYWRDIGNPKMLAKARKEWPRT